MANKKEWFSTWFDSKYYHILYKNRDYQEAEFFISNLIEKLGIENKHRVLDLACGKGRHAIYLNKQGLQVVGVDLSPESIAYANQYANEQLAFYEHDMREVLQQGAFDFVLNLFTSFGYFEDERENEKTIQSIYEIVEEGGTFVIDFMNAQKVIKNLVLEETKTIDGVTFELKRSVQNSFIVKDIAFEVEEERYEFQERVKAITEEMFLQYFQKAGFKVEATYGDYALNSFDVNSSDRLIYVLKK
ncbi:MAG: class I SAM-dependent methyltransferase [Cytophagales bacterium]|nr:class I SAM-dependent methyltransferase [Cytophagales bacterium]